MIASLIHMPALTAAWLLTQDRRYGTARLRPSARVVCYASDAHESQPRILAGRAGVSTGRSYGIIDTLHLVEVARAASLVAPQLMKAQNMRR